jgi:hypothetical protein
VLRVSFVSKTFSELFHEVMERSLAFGTVGADESSGSHELQYLPCPEYIANETAYCLRANTGLMKDNPIYD